MSTLGDSIEKYSRTFRVRTNNFLKHSFQSQTNIMDCGPTCLSIMSYYYGKKLNPAFWRKSMSVDQTGTSIFDIVKVSKEHGLESEAIKISKIEELPKEYFPVIAHLENHFVVVLKKDNKKGKLLISDPDVGKTLETYSDFNDKFKNHVILFSPTEEFLEIKNEKSSYSHFLNIFENYKPELATIFFLSFVVSIISTIPAFVSQYIFDELVTGRDENVLLSLLLLGFLLSVFLNFAGWLQSYFLAQTSAKLDFNSVSWFVKKSFSLNLKFFKTRHIGDFLNRLGEMSRVRTFITGHTVEVILSVINLFVYGFALSMYNSTIAVTVLLTAPLSVLVSMWFSKKLVRIHNKAFEANSKLESKSTEIFKGVSSIKSLNSEGLSRQRYEESLVTSLKSKYDLEVTSATMESSSSVIDSILDYLVLGIAIFLSIKSNFSIGQVIAVTMLASGVRSPFQTFAALWSEIVELKYVLDRLNDVFLESSEEDCDDVKESSFLNSDIKSIEFKNVWFRYGGESSPWIVKGASFRISDFSSVAIVGKSGSGKSTLAFLLNGLYSPTKGEVLINGVDTKEIPPRVIRKKIGLLLQESELFKGTVLENITWSDNKPNFQKAKKAAHIADAIEFINTLTGEYDHGIEYNGDGLSGGQKQRIGLARMIYHDPDVIVLDEATSSLDRSSQRKIIENLNDYEATNLCLFITHSRDVAESCEQIIWISDGSVEGTGEFDQLLIDSPKFRSLFGLENE